MKTGILCLGFLIIFNCGYAQLNERQSGVIADFGKQLITDIANDGLDGSISVAVIKNNKVIWAGAYGYANRDKHIPADTATIYRIGSITKTFTSTLLMQLVEDGKVKLDDPVENYVPEVKKLKGYDDAGKITLRQLASHTSGLKREPDMHGADVGLLNEWQSKVIECIPHTSFNSKPGEQFLYSNIGFAILGLALERAANIPYMQMVQDKIFTPLHMGDTFFAITNAQLPRLAQGLSNNDKGQVNTKLPVNELKGRGYRVPNGGIFSTPRDLAKFVIAMMEQPHLLSAASLRQMQEIPPGGKSYGLGLMISHKWNVIGHNGSVPGYTSQFLIDPNSGYAVILMRNYNTGSTNLEMAAIDLLKKL